MRKSRSIVPIVMAAVVFAGGLWVGNHLPKFFNLSAPKQLYNSTTLLLEVKRLSQLVTVQYTIEKLVVLEDVKWYGENRVMLSAHGIVKAGIELSLIHTNDLIIQTNKIIVRLPPAQITDAYLDDSRTKVVDRTTGVWRSPDKDLEQQTRKMAVEDIRRAARSDGILKKADDQARVLLENLFHQLGFAEVEFQPQLDVQFNLKKD